MADQNDLAGHQDHHRVVNGPDFPHVYGKPGANPGTRRPAVPFDGDVPDVHAGTPVLARDMNGKWWPKIAGAGPRYDHACSIGRTYLTVPVTTPEAYAAAGVSAPMVNWPAEDVKTVPGGEA